MTRTRWLLRENWINHNSRPAETSYQRQAVTADWTVNHFEDWHISLWLVEYTFSQGHVKSHVSPRMHRKVGRRCVWMKALPTNMGHRTIVVLMMAHHLRHRPGIKDSYSCEMRMCGTVKCRSTLAYRVLFDSINISDWTDYKILLQREIGPMLF